MDCFRSQSLIRAFEGAGVAVAVASLGAIALSLAEGAFTGGVDGHAEQGIKLGAMTGFSGLVAASAFNKIASLPIFQWAKHDCIHARGMGVDLRL